MSEHSPLNTQSANMKKALVWMAEVLHHQPLKERSHIVREAGLRFDLTPLECAFLEKHLNTAES